MRHGFVGFHSGSDSKCDPQRHDFGKSVSNIHSEYYSEEDHLNDGHGQKRSDLNIDLEYCLNGDYSNDGF